MILENGCQILVVHRRLFEQDRARFFVGKVDAYENGMARATGHTWIQDTFHGKMQKKEGERTKILSLSSGTLIVYVLPTSFSPNLIRIDYDADGKIIISDGASLHLDLSEGIPQHVGNRK